MFQLCPAPPGISLATLLGLRLSPVCPQIRVDALPAGSACAALAVHSVPDGTRTVTLCIRSLEDGSVVFYGLERALAGQSGISDAVGAAVSFAGTLGLCLDTAEPLVDAPSRERALEAWRSLAHAGDAGAGCLELDLGLEDEAGLDLESILAEREPALDLGTEGVEIGQEGRGGPPQPDPDPDATGGRSSSAPLTKFRGENPAYADTNSRAALGRLRLVKRRKSGVGRADAADPVLLLLASF